MTSFKLVIYVYISKDFGMLFKNRTLMFRCVILVSSDGAIFWSTKIPSPIAWDFCGVNKSI